MPNHFSECPSTFSKTGHQEFAASTIKQLVMTRTASVYASVQELKQQCKTTFESTRRVRIHKLTKFHAISSKSIWEEDEFREKDRKIVKSTLCSGV